MLHYIRKREGEGERKRKKGDAHLPSPSLLPLLLRATSNLPLVTDQCTSSLPHICVHRSVNVNATAAKNAKNTARKMEEEGKGGRGKEEGLFIG